MTDMERLNALLHDSRFWIAVVALVQALVFELWPGFPDAVWQSILVLLSVVIAGMTIERNAKAQTKANAQIIGKLLEVYGGGPSITGSQHMTEAIIDEALTTWGK